MEVTSLCAVLARALDRRIDVQTCIVEPIKDRPNLINVVVTKRSGLETKREASIEPLFDADRPLGDILDDWIGEEPAVQGKRSANWMLDRAQALALTPSAAIRQHELGRKSMKPAKPENIENAQAPGSKLDWDKGHQEAAPAAVIPDPTPAATTYTDPVTNERRPKLKRTDMTKLGMTREQRHEQYRRQGGKHPEDK